MMMQIRPKHGREGEGVGCRAAKARIRRRNNLYNL